MLKFLKDSKVDFTARCCGISSIPCALFFLTRSANRTYSILVKEWKNIEKLLDPFFTNGIDQISMLDALRILMRIGDTLNGVRNHERLYRYIDSLFPAQKIPGGLEIWAFDLFEGKEVVFKEGDDLRKALKISLSFPILYRPYEDRYVPITWITGVPEGELMVLFDIEKETHSPRNALEYLFLSTTARTKHLERERTKKAKCLRISCSSLSPVSTTRRAYEEFPRFFEEVFV
ncbi:hypothetical protein [Thermotoga sp. 38H-to]|uniref:hypothetical protein n=1 Tax=Thermotoga sp. 38H-to TaxID=1755812 RepID=UPI0005442297|nr:hypothetical protein [Thermotoga sp. 38H-to]KAF2959808.1 hypothetical protein AS158_05000 [Thermotoga sp. 38H-to]KHC90273.1 hypothetical protein Mc24_07924 [Thermotoga sp. Mc24]